MARLRSGATLISPEELARGDADWVKWRAEWIRRKKVFNEYVHTGSISNDNSGVVFHPSDCILAHSLPFVGWTSVDGCFRWFGHDATIKGYRLSYVVLTNDSADEYEDQHLCDPF
jgi:hypothetical protein